MTEKDIIEWAAELADYLAKHPTSTRTMAERIWGLVGRRFDQEELDILLDHIEEKLSR